LKKWLLWLFQFRITTFECIAIFNVVHEMVKY
jgi:hypothetical protein